MSGFVSPWPSSEIVEELVRKSSGYFIYVSTVVKFIDDKRFRPVERLDVVLGIKTSMSGSPFDTLDDLYHEILSGVPLDFRPKLIEILVVISADIHLSVPDIEQLVELETGDVRLILRGLHSVICVPADDVHMLTTHHASFLDFLHDPSRSGTFYIDSSQCHSNLAYRLLKVLSYRYDDPLLNKRGHIFW
ncbi:hypothetical protein B0H13DRAFT_1673974 [Mycena leptocephala]|nr:hypothetical protein B0H13DRAFT_1673974 [Mycena leptocephala]